MLTVEKTVLPSPEQWEIIIEGMRNPMNSWDKSDSHCCHESMGDCPHVESCTEPAHDCNNGEWGYCIGEADHALMTNLADDGPVHAKYRRMIPVFVTITAPLYWWKEFDTYKVGTVANSCSTMHKIHAKEFTLDDFSREHLFTGSMFQLHRTVDLLNEARDAFFDCTVSKYETSKECSDAKKAYWWQLIQLLPSSYNQRRTVFLNYEVLTGIYRWRKNHKLDEWRTFCSWIETLPYSELITMTGGDNDG